MTEPAKAKAPVHQYSVALLITAELLDPEHITAVLGVEPAQTWKKGEDARDRSRTAGWELRLEPEQGRFWTSMEDGLHALLSKVEGKRPQLQKLAENHKVAWWIGHFQTSLDGGPMLSPRMLKRLGEFGVPLFIDNYFSKGEE